MDKKGYLWLVYAFILVSIVGFAYAEPAFSFYGSIKNSTYHNVSGANVTIYTMEMGDSLPPVWLNSTTTNANGSFMITVDTEILPPGDLHNMYENPGMPYKIEVVKYNSGIAYERSSILPPLPSMAFVPVCFGDMCMGGELNGTTLYVGRAGTIHLNATNSSGQNVTFSGAVFEASLGQPFETFFTQAGVNTKDIVVPIARNFSVIIVKMPAPGDMTSAVPPQSFTVTSAMLLAAPSNIYNITANMTISVYNVSGRFYSETNTSEINFTNITAHILAGENMLPPGSMPPMVVGTQTDPVGWSVNATTGDFYVNVIGTSAGSKLLITGYASNAHDYYIGYANVTVMGASVTNFNISLYNTSGAVVAGSTAWPVTTRKTTMQIVYNDSTTGNITNVQQGGFAELYVTMPNQHGPVTLRIMAQPDMGGNFTFSFPRGTNVTAKVFNGEFAPLKKKLNISRAVNQLELKSMNTEDPNGNPFSNMGILYYKTGGDCNIPNPSDASCLLSNFSHDNSNVSQGFSPLNMIMNGNVNIMLKEETTGTIVYFVNVDLIASGPPDSQFTNSSSEQARSSASFEQIWKFGSSAPDIYEYVYVAVPYIETQVMEGKPMSINIPLLFDEDWNLVWNLSAGHNISDLPSEYSDWTGSYLNYFNGSNPVNCTNSTSSLCYIDTANNKLWLKFPHFSGVGPEITSIPALGQITTDKSYYSCYPDCLIYVNITVNNTAFVGPLVNISLNRTSPISPMAFNYSYVNYSKTSHWITLSGQNHTMIPLYNVSIYNASLGNDTTIMIRINASMNQNTAGVVNFSVRFGATGTDYPVNISTDTIPPLVAINSPAAANYTNATGNVTINWTVSDANSGGNNASYAVDGAAASTYLGSAVNESSAARIVAGTHVLNIRGTDFAGNVNESNVTIVMNSLINMSNETLRIVAADLGGGFTNLAINDSVTGQVYSNETTLMYINRSINLFLTADQTVYGGSHYANASIFNVSGLALTWNRSIYVDTTNAAQVARIIRETGAAANAGFVMFTNLTNFVPFSAYPRGAQIFFPNTTASLSPIFIDTNSGNALYNLSACSAIPTSIASISQACYNYTSGTGYFLYVPYLGGAALLFDATPPQINMTIPANNSAYADSLANITLVVKEINANATAFCWVNISNSTGAFYYASLSLSQFTSSQMTHTYVYAATGLNNGLYNVTVNCTDSNNNNGQTGFNFTVTDTTAPSVGTPDATVISTTSMTITWTVNEDSNCTLNYSTTSGSGYINVSYGNTFTSGTLPKTISSLAASTTYYYLVSCKDKAGRIATTAEVSDATTSEGTAATTSGGGSSSSAATATKVSKAWETVAAGTDYVWQPGYNAFESVVIQLSATANNVQLSLQKLNSVPSLIDIFQSKNVYQVYDVTKVNLDDTALTRAGFQIKVEKTWYDTIEPSSFAVYRYSHSRWDKVTSRYLSADATYVHFNVTTPGFSYFAILGTNKTANASSSTEAGTGSAETGAGTGTATTAAGTTGNETAGGAPGVKASNKWIWGVVIIIVLLAVAAGVFFFYFKRKPSNVVHIKRGGKKEDLFIRLSREEDK